MVVGLWRCVRWLQAQIEDWRAPERSRVQALWAIAQLPGVQTPKVRHLSLLIRRQPARAEPQRKAS